MDKIAVVTYDRCERHLSSQKAHQFFLIRLTWLFYLSAAHVLAIISHHSDPWFNHPCAIWYVPSKFPVARISPVKSQSGYSTFHPASVILPKLSISHKLTIARWSKIYISWRKYSGKNWRFGRNDLNTGFMLQPGILLSQIQNLSIWARVTTAIFWASEKRWKKEKWKKAQLIGA